MSFTAAEKVDIRRFAGYPAFGGSGAQQGFQNWRYFTAYGTMEFRLNNMAPEEEAVIRTTYLTNLYLLETDIVGSRSNLDTDKAAVWVHNRDEVRHRTQLFNQWRTDLCKFLGVPNGPGLGGGNNMEMVV